MQLVYLNVHLIYEDLHFFYISTLIVTNCNLQLPSKDSAKTFGWHIPEIWG